MLYTDFAVGLGMAYVYLPLMVLPLYASIEKLDFRLIEAAYDLYATPLARADPGRPAAGSAGPGRGLDPGLHPGAGRLCRPAHPGRRQSDDARQPDRPAVRPGPQLAARRAALRSLLMLIVLVALLLYVRQVGAAGARPWLSAPSRSAACRASRPWRSWSSSSSTRRSSLLAIYSFNAGTSLAIWEGFSLRWYVAAWQTSRSRRRRSARSASRPWPAVVSTVLATMAAIATTRTAPFRGQTHRACRSINLPLMAPEIVTAIALLIFFALVKIATGYGGLGYIVLAHTAFCIPFAFLPIRGRLEDMDAVARDAAADLYATPWRAFRRVTLPLLWPGILAGLMLAFVISLDDVVITNLIAGPGQETLPIYMLAQLRRSTTPEINAVSTALLAVSVLLVSLSFLLSREKE